MKSLVKLLSYTALVGGLCAGMMFGTFWLLQADPVSKAEARPAPIAPRIADSIERRKDLTPPAAREPAVALRPMIEAPVALTPPPPPPPPPPPAPAREAAIARPAKPNKAKEIARIAEPAPSPAMSAPRAVITTARSDVPF